MSKLVRVTGNSMSPYLKSDDLVYIDDLTPELGDLVLIKKVINNQLAVHRYLGEDKFKGDRIKDYDQNIWGDLELCGRVCGVQSRSGYQSFEKKSYYTTHKVQALLSRLNVYENLIFSKVVVLVLIILGKTSRALQGRL